MSASRPSRAAPWLAPISMGAVLLTTGCSIPLSTQGTMEQTNTCSSSADCGTGATCALVGSSKACVSTSIALQGLLLEVQPSSAASFGAGTSFLLEDLASKALPGTDPVGVVIPFDATLPPLVSVAAGSFSLGYDFLPAVPGCATAKGKPFPAIVEFHRVAPYLGLDASTYSSSSSDAATAFQLAMPAGQYDIYVQPQLTAACVMAMPGALPPPPVLVPDVSLDKDTGFNLRLNPPRYLTGWLTVPAGVDVEGWFLELIDGQSGRVVSDTLTLTQASGGHVTIGSAGAILRYTVPAPARQPILRLRPKAMVAAPTIYWGLAALELQSGAAHLTVPDLLTGGRKVDGYVQGLDHQPVAATVQIQSTSLLGGFDGNASYSLTLQTDPGLPGHFSAQLPPGQYHATAVPLADASKAIGQTTPDWQIDTSSSCFCGHVIVVPDRTDLTGVALLPSAAPFVSGTVFASPSFADPTTYLIAALGLGTTLLPQGSSGAPDATGTFSLGVDPAPATYDLSVRPDDGTLYPWLVRPRATPSDQGSLTWNVGELLLASPAMVRGKLVDPDGNPVAQAAVNAWVPVTDPNHANAPMRTVIQIGTTLTGDDGSYTLALPPSIAQ